MRNWTCPDCLSIHDRDENAAKNLIGLAITQLQTTASSAGSNACGEVGSGKVRKNRVKPTSMKQENNTKLSLVNFGLVYWSGIGRSKTSL